MKRIFALALAAALLTTPAMAVQTLQDEQLTIPAPAAVLMEKTTGAVLYTKNADERYSPASVTKVMTLLLVMEALEAGTVTAEQAVFASARAASMGGSQIWLEEGESMTVHEMLKCVAVVSANDCAVALAELLCGTEEAFVQRMNQRAGELGMTNTHFTNCTGLFDDDDHYTSALDVALMSRALILHEEVKQYTTIWMDTVRNGEFGLSNTNKLIFYYDGATGLKTGFTARAMYCLAATAQRDGAEYIAVVLHADTSAERFDAAKTLLSCAFANYAVVTLRPDLALPPVPVTLGASDAVQPVYGGNDTLLCKKGESAALSYDIELAPSLTAPVAAGDEVGMMTVRGGGEVVAMVPLLARDDVARLGFWELYARLLLCVFGVKAV